MLIHRRKIWSFGLKFFNVLEATFFRHFTQVSFLSRITGLRCNYSVRCEAVRFLTNDFQPQYKAPFTFVSHAAFFFKQNSQQVAMELRLLKTPLKLSRFTKVWTQNETTLKRFLTFSFLS